MNSAFVKHFYSTILWILIIIVITSCGKSGNGPTEQSVNIYLVSMKGSNLGGKIIGCNDILVPVTKNVLVEKSTLESAIIELLSVKQEGELINFVIGPGLLLANVTIAHGVADIYLKGDFRITGPCDIPRIQEQLYETAKQFPEIKIIHYFINAQTLEDYLTSAKDSF